MYQYVVLHLDMAEILQRCDTNIFYFETPKLQIGFGSHFVIHTSHRHAFVTVLRFQYYTHTHTHTHILHNYLYIVSNKETTVSITLKMVFLKLQRYELEHIPNSIIPKVFE